MNTYAAIADPAGTAGQDRQSRWFWSRKKSGGIGLPAVCLALFLAAGFTASTTARAAGEDAVAVLATEMMNAIVAEYIDFLLEEVGLTAEQADCAVFLEIAAEIASAEGDCDLETLADFIFFFSIFQSSKGDGGTVIVGGIAGDNGDLNIAGGVMPPQEVRDGVTFQCAEIEFRRPADGMVVKKLSQDGFQRPSKEMGKMVLRGDGIGNEIGGDGQAQGKALTLTTYEQGPGNQPAAIQSTREDLASGSTLRPGFLLAVLDGAPSIPISELRGIVSARFGGQ